LLVWYVTGESTWFPEKEVLEMLRSIKGITGYVLQAEDGEIGRCKDFLWDDEEWVVRYMVADTGKWLPERKVLVSPNSLGEADFLSQQLAVRLTKKQIEDAPTLDKNAPVSRQYQVQWNQYFGDLIYRTGRGSWGGTSNLKALGDATEGPPPATLGDSGDPHLRSAEEVIGYHIQAEDGEIGHVEDFVVDDQNWFLRYMVVDTRNWLPGRKVLIAPSWIDGIDWPERRVGVNLTTEAVRESPQYDSAAPVNREYEERLYDYYGRPKYWQRPEESRPSS
jgi:hypothetical protein